MYNVYSYLMELVVYVKTWIFMKHNLILLLYDDSRI